MRKKQKSYLKKKKNKPSKKKKATKTPKTEKIIKNATYNIQQKYELVLLVTIVLNGHCAKQDNS